MSLLIPSVHWKASDHERIVDGLKTKNALAVKRGVINDIRGTCRALLSISSAQSVELPFAHGPELHFNY
jgi:hypothetical protein